MFIPHPLIWGVVAEIDGRIVGSNFLDERDPIRGVGPITVDPEGQNAGVGRKLMEAVLERGEGAPGVRLLQDAFHMRSLSLYASLGFDVKEPRRRDHREAAQRARRGRRGATARGGRPRRVRGPLQEGPRLRAHERASRRDAGFAPFVALRDGRIVAYASTVTFWPMNHGVAESDDDMKALLHGAAAAVEEPLAFLVPLRYGPFPVVPRGRPSSGQADEPDGARGVPGAAGRAGSRRCVLRG